MSAGWTAEALRAHIGEEFESERDHTDAEKCTRGLRRLRDEPYGGPGSHTGFGGTGVLVAVEERPNADISCVRGCHRGDTTTVLPWIVTDYGFSWPITPDTTVTFTPVDGAR